MITFHFIFARKHSETNAYPVRVGFSEDTLPAILAAYNEIVTPSAGASFRDAHAEILVGSFSSVTGYQQHEYHEFPNPSDLKKRADRESRQAAEAVAAELSTAETELAAARAKVAAAKAKKADLTPGQKSHIAPGPDPAAAKVAEQTAAAAVAAERKRANAANKLATSQSISETAGAQLEAAQ